MDDIEGWMRYVISDGKDQRDRVADLQNTAQSIGCISRAERGAGVMSVDVWVPRNIDFTYANVLICIMTDETPHYDMPPYSSAAFGGQCDAR